MEKKGLSQEEMEKELTEFKPDTSEADAFEKELEEFVFNHPGGSIGKLK